MSGQTNILVKIPKLLIMQGMNALEHIRTAKTIIIKIGSALLVDPERGVKQAWLAALAEDVMDLR